MASGDGEGETRLDDGGDDLLEASDTTATDAGPRYAAERADKRIAPARDGDCTQRRTRTAHASTRNLPLPRSRAHRRSARAVTCTGTSIRRQYDRARTIASRDRADASADPPRDRGRPIDQKRSASATEARPALRRRCITASHGHRDDGSGRLQGDQRATGSVYGDRGLTSEHPEAARDATAGSSEGNETDNLYSVAVSQEDEVARNPPCVSRTGTDLATRSTRTAPHARMPRRTATRSARRRPHGGRRRSHRRSEQVARAVDGHAALQGATFDLTPNDFMEVMHVEAELGTAGDPPPARPSHGGAGATAVTTADARRPPSKLSAANVAAAVRAGIASAGLDWIQAASGADATRPGRTRSTRSERAATATRTTRARRGRRAAGR